jgi:hypothetical protein
MEDLAICFVLGETLVMSLDNPTKRLEMTVPLTGLTSISLKQGIELARATWFAFNPQGSDIGPFITSAAECTRYRIIRSDRGIREQATLRLKKGVFLVEVTIPTYQFLEGIRSDTNSVVVKPPFGLYKNEHTTLVGHINTSKVVPAKTSLLAKLAEMAIRAVAGSSSGASSGSSSKSPVKPPVDQVVQASQKDEVTPPTRTVESLPATSEISSLQTSSANESAAAEE